MENDQAAWWDIMHRLQKILRRGACDLYQAKKMDLEQMHNYVMSGQMHNYVMSGQMYNYAMPGQMQNHGTSGQM